MNPTINEDNSEPAPELAKANFDNDSRNPTRDISMKIYWQNRLNSTLPHYKDQLLEFFKDSDKGFQHSLNVYDRARELGLLIEGEDKISLNWEAIEQLSIFHDIGKFFQHLHSLENLSIAQRLYEEFAGKLEIDPYTRQIVLHGIGSSDFYNKRLDPITEPPLKLEEDIVRCADKTLDNIVSKVDRYWFEYGVPRGATFFDPLLSFDERQEFSFANFKGDQLNVILSIIALRPDDFTHPVLQQAYAKWSKKPKDEVCNRIMGLAADLNLSPEHQDSVRCIIHEYRQRFNC